ncbi:MAG TPA: hypothetical protein VNT24_06705 [Propionibacteriaceae bacterium]|nr:hypothetical protein [Propionibacteriaceae bacterium]
MTLVAGVSASIHEARITGNASGPFRLNKNACETVHRASTSTWNLRARGPSTGHFGDDHLGSIACPEHSSGPARPRPSSRVCGAEDDRADGGELLRDQLAQHIVT